ncbi:MAG: cytochrome c [Chthoniobacteraceae bacterium]
MKPVVLTAALNFTVKLAVMMGICGGGWRACADDPPAHRSRINYDLFDQGRYVYERNCLLCHGVKGDGNGEFAKDLQPKPRSFREGWFKFRTTPYDKLPTDDDLRRTITGGLSGTAMGMFTGLSSSEVTAVIEYVKTFSRRWRHAENDAPALEMPEPPAWLRNADATRSHASAGNVLFATICATCHGAKGDGNGLAVPALKDGWGFPAQPADLRQAHLRCGDGAADIFRILSTGMSGTPMVNFAPALTEVQRWDIAAYILSIRLPPPGVLGAPVKTAQ